MSKTQSTSTKAISLSKGSKDANKPLGDNHTSTGSGLTSNPDPNRAPTRLLTPEDVAEQLGTSTDWVYDHVNRREPKLRAVRLCTNTGRGRTMIRFRPKDVEEFIELLLDPPQQRAS